jgi:hypothetical protein
LAAAADPISPPGAPFLSITLLALERRAIAAIRRPDRPDDTAPRRLLQSSGATPATRPTPVRRT